MHSGSCLCGAVKFKVIGNLAHADACHCVQCRKWTGHFLASVEVKSNSLQLNSEHALKWHQSSVKARRGFCGECGSSLFFDPIDKDKHDWIGVSLGAFDGAVQLKLTKHIFVAEKGAYYHLNDDVQQFEH